LIGLIVDNLRLRNWQAAALSDIAESADFVVFNCTNSRSSHHYLRHAAYYALNLVSLKTRETRSRSLPQSLSIQETISFEAIVEDGWERFPEDLTEKIAELRPQVLIKFGMGLLRVPEQLDIPILSYHHGDLRRYRGRPAGFYELINGDSTVGQVVQILSNRLDAGAVVAFAESQVYRHSYRQTMIEAYRTSRLILSTAVRNAISGVCLPLEPTGKNCRLPSNATVMHTAGKILAAKAQRWIYGLFFEKGWRVAEAPVDGSDAAHFLRQFPSTGRWKELACPRRYRFIADPFPDPRGGVLVEGMRRRDDRGEIVRLTNDSRSVVCSGRGHFSYPVPSRVGSDLFVLPEVAKWSPPILYRLTDSGAAAVGPLPIEGTPRLVDATPFTAEDGTIFLFANRSDEGRGVLRLWTAAGFAEPFVEHPMSPIRISPLGSRMGGCLFSGNGKLFRTGQDCSRDYGDGVGLFEIVELSADRFEERLVAKCRFEAVKGPHTINISEGKVLFDYYDHRFSLTAGLRRLLVRLRG